MSQHELEEHPQQQQQSDITSLQENFSKQQEKISALKELVRKSEVAHGKSTSSAQEKVKNIALRLTNLKSKARSRQNLDSSTTSLNESQFQSQENLYLLQSQCSTTTDAGGGGGGFIETPQRPLSARIETPGSEKILLLRKQMEENKVKMAEREHSKREIEHMVTQLKAKFDTTQQCLEHSSELGRSMGDLSNLSYSSVGSKVRSATDLASAPFNLDKERIKFLDNRVRLLEKQLEKEKTSSDASKRVKELENKILELEESLLEKRTRDLVATLNDHEVEESWQIENDRLKTELEEKSKRILHLEEVTDILETTKCDLTEKTQELEAKLKESETNSKKLEEKLETLKSTVDSQKFEMIPEADIDRQVEQELLKQVHQLESKIKELEDDNDELRQENENLQEVNKAERGDDETDSLQATVESQREDIMTHIERVKELEEELMEKTIELNVLNANFAVLEEKLKVPSRKPLFATLSDGEVSSLKDELEETKKTAKHLEKQLNEFKRMSDMHASVVELTDENEELQQRITELEDEKGQLLLKMESGEHTTIVTEIEIEKKIEYLEATCQNQTSAIQLLEEQKIDMTEDLESTKSELECARVVSEMESIQLEEQVNTNLQKIEELQRENVDLTHIVEELREEKSSLAKKMEQYVAENMELLDKIEKLSKSSSSAESIEIVERLTQQDRLEIEAFNKRVEQEEARLMMTEGSTIGQQSMDPELTDSLVKLKEESSELMHKIELFTTERKEVLEKMESITAENQEHLKKIEQLSVEKLELEKSNEAANFQKEALQKKFDDANSEKESIRREIREVSEEKTKITAELNSMIKAASLTAPSDGKDLLDKCEKSLAKLNTELEAYRKANDKNAKFNASKKLSKEAKNTHQQLTELLQKVKTASTEAAAAVSPVVDDAKVAELQSDIADLREKLSTAAIASEDKDTQISRLNEEIVSLKSMSEQFDKLINDKEMAHEKQIENLTRLRRELEAKLETSEAEMKILQDLIAEQKQQLIEAYTDSENEIAKRIEELNARDEEVSNLKSELKALKENSGQVGQQFSNDLQLEVDKLREALSINKSLLTEQIDDLTNKQETIETLNAQIMELYKTMEENAEKVIEKEDEIALVQEQLDANKVKIEQLTKENEEQNQVVDKLLLELHSQKTHLEKLTQLPILEEENAKLSEENQTLEENLQIAELRTSQLEKTVKDLEQKNKEQLDKLKKYAANLKKKVTQCQEFEAKIKNLEKGALDAKAQEKNPLIDTLQNQLEEKTTQVQSLQEEFNQQRKHFEECVLKVQEALDGVQHEMTSLREQLHEKTMQVEELQLALIEKSQDQPDFESMQEQLRQYHNLINERNAKIDELNDIIESAEPYHDDLNNLREELKQKNITIAQLNETNVILQGHLNDAQQRQFTTNMAGLDLQRLQDEIRNLQNLLNEKNAKIDELNEQIAESKPLQAAEELRNLHNLINERNSKIDELNNIILAAEPYYEELQLLREQLNEKNTAIKELNEQNLALQLVPNTCPQIVSLQDELRNLQNLLNEKNAKIDELREQILEAQPFQDNQEALRNLHNELNEKNAKIDELNDIIHEAEPYHAELQQLREQLVEKNTAINELNTQIFMANQQNDSNIQLVTELTSIREQLNAKEKEIEKQNKILDSTEEQLSSLQEELDQKNEQIQQLNGQLNSIQVPTGVSLDEIKLKDAKIEELTKESKAKSVKFEKSKAVIKEKNKEIQRLNQLLSKEVEEGNIAPTTAPTQLQAAPQPQVDTKATSAELEELRNENTKMRVEAAVERATFQETIARLETVHDGIQAKLQEDMSYIETLEQENNNFKEKICRLEECVAMFEERRSSMERRANLLDAQLQTRTDEHAKVEDELVYRLNMLSDHDDIIGQRLFEAQEENEVLSNRLETLRTEHSALVANYAKLEKEYAGFKEHTKNTLEADNQSLKTQVATLDAEMKRLRGVFETQLAAKDSEIDELENDLSEQLRVINDEKRLLTEELEKTKDEISELKDERVRLNETMNSLEQAKSDLERESTWIKMQNENLSQDQFELQELRMQSMQDRTELENLKHQIDTLVQNHEIELNALRTQISELDSMRMQVGQNQTDDQVFIETENKRLTDLLAEKESIIENYQRQNLQLQMNALAARQQPVDPFASLTQSDDNAQMTNLREKCDRLERELNEKQREIEQMRMEHHQQVVVPPPLAFFGAEQAMPSVFDEIVTTRHVDGLHGAAPSRAMAPPPPSSFDEEPAGNQQTIEDLQRNVSDLEKHAQDLENKLVHRTAAHEDSLRQLEEIKRTFEIRMREYEDRIRDLELRQDTKAIDCQIISAAEQQVPSLNMFFQGAAEQSPFESIIIPQVSSEPVVEEMIVPTKAYDCHPQEQQLELDEGWGWGSDEAALEAKHFAATSSAASSLLPPQQQMELKLQEHQDRIQELELERDRLVQQKQDMQVKSGKLMKKLKEYKTKIDELYSQAAFRKSSSVESSDLDLAIQEEMKSQLKQLEEKLTEAKKLTDTQSLEKENLLKRIDVLTAGNERMAEMKERQDNDVVMYKSRVRELTEKIKGLEEWSASAATSEAAPPVAAEGTSPSTVAVHELEKSNQLLEKKIEELLSEIDDISGDRTELQALLDEEKTNVQRAEQAVKTLNENITRLENSAGSESADHKFQFNEIKLENQNLKSQLTDAQGVLTREKKERQEETKRLEKQNQELSNEVEKLKLVSGKASELETKLERISEEKQNLIQELEELRVELSFTPKPLSASDELQQQLVRLQCDLESVVMQNQDLGREVDRLRAESVKLNETNQQLLQEINSTKLQQSFNATSDDKSIDLTSEVNRLQLELQALKQTNEELSTEINRMQLQSTFNVAGSGFAETEKLSSEVNRLNTELQTVTNKNEELTQEIAQLRLDLSEKESLQSEISRLTNENQSLNSQIGRFKLESSSSNQLNDLEEQIQEKDSEIMHLKQRIEDLMREDQTEKLVLEILTKNQEIHMLKMQVKNLEDDKLELDHNLSMQITQEMNAKRVDDSAEKIQQLQEELENMRIEKGHMEEELQVLNNHVMTSLENEEKMKAVVLELDTKNIEIAELRRSLGTVGNQKPSADAPSNAQWEAVIEQRCGEIAEMWRAHLDTREKEFIATENKLKQQIEALQTTGRVSPPPPSQQQNYPTDDISSASSSKDSTPDPDLIQKMQQALENQEVEIVTLKEQLAIRSAEYARLAAQFDPYKMQSTMSHSSGFSSDGQRPQPALQASQVPKSELDLALYMLHQRDMRCEELTLELVHLLEERDTLQLKLSNTLRQMEAIKTTQSGSEPSQGDLTTPAESPEKPQLSPPAVSQLPESDELHQKLSQLHSVSHSKRFQEERDMRQRQMEQIQQDVAKMPSEALSELVGSDLSQSNQSPSSVLLNWLWGKPSGGGQS
ncbi:protein lava lamp [Episyrphus balteatus]|uniref:protein lava lamp n=1 Tax=Episyrphus balteatus TaxID=286459 RepID=UPI002485AF6A|nr:protein lava lamp [Episyrphus balteatus]